jgi:hypothetical protein
VCLQSSTTTQTAAFVCGVVAFEIGLRFRVFNHLVFYLDKYNFHKRRAPVGLSFKPCRTTTLTGRFFNLLTMVLAFT